MGKSVRVKKGDEILEISDTDLPAAAKDGYLPTERIIVANPKTKESFEIAPEDYQHALQDGFNFTDIVKGKGQTPSAVPVEQAAQVTPQSLRELNELANKPVTQYVATAEDVGAAGPQPDQGQYAAKQDFDKGLKDISAKWGIEPENAQKAILDFPHITDDDRLKYLSGLSKGNPVKYDRIKAADKNRQLIANSDIPGAIHAANDYNDLQEQQDHSELIRNIEGQKYIINTALSGEQRTQAHANLEREKAPLINSLSEGVRKDYQASKFNSILSPDQYAGLEELKIFRPDFYEQIVKELEQDESIKKETPEDLKIGYHGSENKKTVQADAPQLLGLEVIKKSLADVGRHNLGAFIQEKVGDLEEVYKKAQSDDEKEEIRQQYIDYKKVSDELETDKSKDDERYPRLSAMKLDEAVREETNNPKFNPLEYGVYKFAKGVENTGESIENLFTGLFAGEDTNTQLAIKRIGEGRLGQNEAFLPAKLRHNDNLFSKATLYSNAGMIGDIASIAAQSAALGGAGASKLLSTAIPMFTTTQNEFYKEALEAGDANPMAKANVNALIMAAAGLINPDLNIVKRSLGLNTVAGKALAGIDEATWKSVVEKNKPLLQKIQNSFKSTAKEGAKLGLVYGAGTSIARDIANKELFDEDISGSEMVNRAVQATKDLALSSVALMGIHAIANFKSTSPQQKGAIWEAGQNPDFAIEAIEEAGRKGEIPQTTVDLRKQAVKDISGLINKVPTESKKGKPLSDKDRIDYLYNMVVNKKAKKLAEDLPEAQKEDVTHTALVADYKNNLILEPKTDTQLGARKRTLERDLEPPKVVEGKKEPEKLSDKEKASAKAELEAINDILELKTKQNETEKANQASGQAEVLGNEGAQPAPSTISVIQPGEIKPRETITIKPKENAIQQRSDEALGAHGNGTESIGGKGESSGMGQGEQRTEPTGEGPTKESESKGEEKVNNPAPESPDMTGITHAQMDATAKEFGLTTYQESPEKIVTWDKQADERFAKDPDAMNKLLNKMRNGEQPDAVEQRMMIKYIADLKAKIRTNPSDALLTQLKRAKDLSNIVGGRDVAKSLRARQGEIPVEEQEVGDFMITKMEANGVSKLTEDQKASAKQHYDEVSSTKKAYDEKIAKLEAENAKLKAANQVKKETEASKKSTTKKSNRDYKKEIDDVWTDLKKHWDEGKGQLSATIIPYADRLIKIAPDVLKLMKIYVEKGVTDLGEIVKHIHERAKEVIPEVTERDIHDIIAGEYKTPRPTRSTLMAKIKDLRDEAELINRLEKLENGEVPKNEKSKVKRNQKIEELRKQIKEHDETKLAAHKANLERQRKKLEEKIQKGDFEPEAPKEPLKLDKEATDLRDAYLKAKEDWDIEIMKDEYGKRGAWEKIGRGASEVLAVGRVAKSSFDVSMPFRQGLWGVARQLLTLPIGENKGFATQKQLASQFGKMYRALASEKVSRRIMADIKESPRYEMAQEAGLDIADPNSRLSEAREEVYGPSLVERIPIIGKPISIGKGRKIGGFVKASERNATVFVNSMKWDIFNNFVNMFENQGKTFENSKELYERAAVYANQAVGRGKLHEGIERANQVTSKFFFSLRLQASRLQLLTNFANPYFYAKVPKEIRNAYLKDMVRFVAMGTTVMGIAHAAGLSVGVNPYASDFGKIKVGDTTYDVWGGFSQWAVLLSRLMAGKSATVGGQTKKLGDANGPKNRGELLLKFARSKASPEAGVAYNLLTGKDYNNKKTDLGKEAVGFITPLLAQDIVQVSQDASVQQSIITAVLASHGIGVQTYKPLTEEDKNKEKSEEKISKWVEKLNLGKDAKKYTPSMIEFEPSKPKPTDEQAKELNETISQSQQDLFKKVQSELDWDNMTDKQKQVAIETVLKEGQDIGRDTFEAKYPDLKAKRPEISDVQRQKEREQSEKEREIQRKIAAKARELSKP